MNSLSHRPTPCDHIRFPDPASVRVGVVARRPTIATVDALDGTAFDFWVGEWDCAFEGGHAVNTVTREFGGQVVMERFRMDAPRAWAGMSASVYNPDLRLWRQTWVDETGNYWHFVGTSVDGDPAFATPEPVDTDTMFKRMVFSDVTADAFRWRWESSPDGTTWTVNWALDYTRRAAAGPS